MYVFNVMCVQVPVKARRGYRIPGAGAAGGCKSPDFGAGNKTFVL